ncbi:MAG: D-alanine--D-alanine ligase [Gemmatimonadetes bacterium]|nr:D-alanine--D-alanine ligase [Gemmatimonadota bacterium]
MRELRIGFAYNEKPSEDAEPPSGQPLPVDRLPASNGAVPASLSPALHDRFAEWDEPATIAAIEAALRRRGTVIRMEADTDFPAKLREQLPDIVFNIAEGLNGPNREAHVPAICEYYGVPYTASDPLTLALALDKRRAKEIFRARGVCTPAYVLVGDGAGPDLPASFPLPAVVKPLYEGSSMGISERAYCTTPEQVAARVAEVVGEYDEPALVEEFLPGREFTVAILGNGQTARVLPIVEIRFDALPAGALPLYGYEAKWIWDTADQPLQIFDCPAPLEPPLAHALESAALAAYHALGCRDWGRVDMRLDARGVPHVLEINPLPGILPDPRQNSCFPKAARAAGIDYDELICTVLDSALARYGMRP